MYSFNNSQFGDQTLVIPEDTQYIVVSDLFTPEYYGGAELTTQALIDACPGKILCLKSREISMKILEKGANAFWIFGNYSEINPQLIPTIVANLNYSILEYDFKYCRYRSPEKHRSVENKECDCHNQMNGKMISAFMYGAKHLFWMSERQQQHYSSRFPFLSDVDNTVLSSVFSPETLARLSLLKQSIDQTSKKGWVVLDSQSWVKGASAAKDWCKENNKDVDLIWNVDYDETLARLAVAEGFVYLPQGMDTCPRMVIEAKLLGCKLHLNDYVLHKDEEWFVTDNLKDITDYLYTTPGLFWEIIKKHSEYRPSISGYTTTYNCIKQDYPFIESIKSMLEFCDEVCVVDGGSIDGTWEKLVELAYPEISKLNAHDHLCLIEDLRIIGASPITENFKKSKLVLKQIERPWTIPRHAIFDGQQKAEARKLCTNEFCWQMDSDEIVHEDDCAKILQLCSKIPKNLDIIALPVIEYWGNKDKVRIDVMPWKWRLSRNNPDVTHGIPVDLRKIDSTGALYAAEGTDGCDMIYESSGDRVPFVNFFDGATNNVRQLALSGNSQAISNYQLWFNQVINELPCVFHYSWFNIERKIRLYRDYWQNHWSGLYNKDSSDSPENNMFFGVPWSEVTDEMIKERADQLKKIGGWIWHSKWNGEQTPWIQVERSEPIFMIK